MVRALRGNRTQALEEKLSREDLTGPGVGSTLEEAVQAAGRAGMGQTMLLAIFPSPSAIKESWLQVSAQNSWAPVGPEHSLALVKTHPVHSLRADFKHNDPLHPLYLLNSVAAQSLELWLPPGLEKAHTSGPQGLTEGARPRTLRQHTLSDQARTEARDGRGGFTVPS